MNKTIFIAAMLAVATVLAAGLTVLPSSVQEAQANPCSNEVTGEANSGDSSSGTTTGAAAIDGVEQNCDFTGPVEFDED